jgi:hypothetical protein
MRTVQIELLEPPRQQVVRPFAGKDTEIRRGNGQVVHNAPIELRHQPAPATPISPPTGEPTEKTGPLTGLDWVDHISLHRSMSLCLCSLRHEACGGAVSSGSTGIADTGSTQTRRLRTSFTPGTFSAATPIACRAQSSVTEPQSSTMPL